MERRLFRSRTNRWIAGVAAGLATFLRTDPMLVRAGFVLLALWNGFGILLYIVMILIVPEEPPEGARVEGPQPPPPQTWDAETRNRNLGTLLVLGGIYFLIQSAPALSPYVREAVVAFTLIVAGVVLLLVRRPAP